MEAAAKAAPVPPKKSVVKAAVVTAREEGAGPRGKAKSKAKAKAKAKAKSKAKAQPKAKAQQKAAAEVGAKVAAKAKAAAMPDGNYEGNYVTMYYKQSGQSSHAIGIRQSGYPKRQVMSFTASKEDHSQVQMMFVGALVVRKLMEEKLSFDAAKEFAKQQLATLKAEDG